MKYEYTRICKCGEIEKIEVNRKEAAFGLKLHEIYSLICKKCGNIKFNSLSHPNVEINKEILLEWGNNLNYYFMEQDEDLMLAEENNIELILDVLDNHRILKEKRNILIGVLCVMIFDNSENYSNNKELVDRVSIELKNRLDDVLDAQDRVMDYIKIIVFPKIGIKYPEKTMSIKNNKIFKKFKGFWS